MSEVARRSGVIQLTQHPYRWVGDISAHPYWLRTVDRCNGCLQRGIAGACRKPFRAAHHV